MFSRCQKALNLSATKRCSSLPSPFTPVFACVSLVDGKIVTMTFPGLCIAGLYSLLAMLWMLFLLMTSTIYFACCLFHCTDVLLFSCMIVTIWTATMFHTIELHAVLLSVCLLCQLCLWHIVAYYVRCNTRGSNLKETSALPCKGQHSSEEYRKLASSFQISSHSALQFPGKKYFPHLYYMRHHIVFLLLCW